jgi:hypothetical protein
MVEAGVSLPFLTVTFTLIFSPALDSRLLAALTNFWYPSLYIVEHIHAARDVKVYGNRIVQVCVYR